MAASLRIAKQDLIALLEGKLALAKKEDVINLRKFGKDVRDGFAAWQKDLKEMLSWTLEEAKENNFNFPNRNCWNRKAYHPGCPTCLETWIKRTLEAVKMDARKIIPVVLHDDIHRAILWQPAKLEDPNSLCDKLAGH